MVGPGNRIRERIAQAATGKAREIIRADEVFGAVAGIQPGFSVRRGSLDIVFQRSPAFVRDSLGNPTGVDALIGVYRGGVEQEIDGHRPVFNPPTAVPDGTFHQYLTARGNLIDLPNYREDPFEAYLAGLEDSIRTVPNPAGWRRPAGTVTTIYSATNDNTLSSRDTVLATARAGSGVVADPDTNLTVAFGGLWFSPEYIFIEALLAFDTSVLAGQAVSAVAMGLWGAGDNSVTDFIMEARPYDFGATIGTEDWIPGDNLAGLSLCGSLSTASYSLGAYNTLVENGSNFVNAIDVNGTTRISLSSSRLRDGSTPSTDEFVDVSSANEAGTTQDPKLTITHVLALVPTLDYRTHPTHALREANTPAGSPLR